MENIYTGLEYLCIFCGAGLLSYLFMKILEVLER